MAAQFPDGRVFAMQAGDRTYGHVFVEGAHEPAETNVVLNVLAPGDFAVDIGANHGWFTIAMAQCVGAEGRVWAFEPMPSAVAVLKEQRNLNPHIEFDIFPLALGANAGEASLHIFAELPHGHASMSALGRSDADAIPISVTTLDSALRDAPRTPLLIKLDAEGAELAILRGGQATMQSASAPLVLLEVNYETSAAFGYEPVELVEFLANANSYAPFRVAGGGLRRDESPHEAPHGSSWLIVPNVHLARIASLVRNHV